MKVRVGSGQDGTGQTYGYVMFLYSDLPLISLRLIPDGGHHVLVPGCRVWFILYDLEEEFGEKPFTSLTLIIISSQRYCPESVPSYFLGSWEP